jgi:hypothetical protein
MSTATVFDSRIASDARVTVLTAAVVVLLLGALWAIAAVARDELR